MLKRLFAICILTGLVSGAAFAAEIGLTSVLYPEGKKIDVPISGTQRAPAATLDTVVEYGGGQSSIQIKYKGLVPAVLFGGDFVAYVVWTVTPDGSVENLGGIANDGSADGAVAFSTGKRDFALMITAEPLVVVPRPSDLVMFFSSTPAGKDVKPTGFTYGGLATREGLVTRERESIAGMTYTPDKQNPLEFIQAEKAVELLDRLDAKKYDRTTYDQAMAAMTQARESKKQDRIKASEQVTVLAGQALLKTARMIETEKAAAAEAAATAQRVALQGTAGDLESELEASQADLNATRTRLAQIEAQLQQAQAQNRKLAGREQTLDEQLAGAVGKMATGTKTDRGYVVSLSGTAFGSGQSTLTTDAKYVLAKLSGMLLALPDARLTIEGNTDSTGSAELNQNLSTDRASSVKMFLGEMGFPVSSMSSQGFGSTRPVAPNDTEGGRAKNRRVDIVITGA